MRIFRQLRRIETMPTLSPRRSFAAAVASAVLVLGACGESPERSSSSAVKSSSSASLAGCGEPSETVEVTASASLFDKECLAAKAGKLIKVEFHNKDDYQHIFSVLEKKGGKKIFASPYFEGLMSNTAEVPALVAGSYRFECNIHPAIMEGRLSVS